MWDNPIFVRARQVENRKCGTGPWLWLKRYGAVFFLLLGPVMLIFPQTVLLVAGEPQDVPRYRTTLFEFWTAALAFSQVALTLRWVWMSLLSVPQLRAREQEQRTLDSLRSTMMSSKEIVWGLLITGLWPVLREMAAVIPPMLTMSLLAGRLTPAVQGLLITLALILAGSLFALMVSGVKRATLWVLPWFLMVGTPISYYGDSPGVGWSQCFSYLAGYALLSALFFGVNVVRERRAC